MNQRKISKIIQWWVTPKLPAIHIWIKPEDKPKDFKLLIRLYFRKWLVHALKRRIAKYYLVILRKFFGLKVIGITGSSGKTTTKEMLVSILKNKGETVFSFANIDPVYNIPTTILKCWSGTKFLVLEMGVEYPGEMDFYLWLAKPDIGIITNISPTHTEYFKSVDGVYKEKMKLVQSLSKENYAILGSENKFLQRLKGRLNSRIFWSGREGDILWNSISDILDDGKYGFRILHQKDKKNTFVQETIYIKLPVLGDQNVANAMSAASCAFILGFSLEEIKKGLESYSPPEHRLSVMKHKSGALILDDSYNSNPEAAKEALEAFYWSFPNRKKVIIFGDMLELGKLEKQYHLKLAKIIAKCKNKGTLDFLITVGEVSKVISDYVNEKKIYQHENCCYHVDNWKEALKKVKPFLKKDYAIFIKGSHAVGLDNLVNALVKISN